MTRSGRRGPRSRGLEQSTLSVEDTAAAVTGNTVAGVVRRGATCRVGLASVSAVQSVPFSQYRQYSCAATSSRCSRSLLSIGS